MNDRPEWFAPKRYGLGAGLPIAWQGWALLAAFLAIIATTGVLLDDRPVLQAAIVFPLLALLIMIIVRTTRGGWRWRWGGED